MMGTIARPTAAIYDHACLPTQCREETARTLTAWHYRRVLARGPRPRRNPVRRSGTTANPGTERQPSRVRAEAAWGLARLGPLAITAVQARADVLNDSEHQVRAWAPWALAE